MKETHYPTLYIDDIDDKRLAEMPDYWHPDDPLQD